MKLKIFKRTSLPPQVVVATKSSERERFELIPALKRESPLPTEQAWAMPMVIFYADNFDNPSNDLDETVYDLPSENGGKTSKRNKSLEANSQQLARSDLFAGLVMMTL